MAGSMAKRLQFSLSPHKVALSILIQDLCSPDRVPPVARPLLAVFLLDHVRQAQDYREKTLSELCAALSALQPPVSNALAHQLVQALRKIGSPDELFDALMALELLIMDNPAVDDDIPGLEQSSVLGIFVRKVLITFHASMFEGLSELYAQVEEYIDSFSNHAAGDKAADEESTLHTELCHFLHHHGGLVEKAPPSLHLDPRIDRMLHRMGNPPGGSYLRYLYSMQHKDYPAAVEHLHRYFDYGMFGRALRSERNDIKDRPVFQWALLNLAGLHFRFGHMALALQALEETVRLAQHASDHKCLANALYWLVRLVAVAGDRQLEGQLVRRCLQRACQLRLPKLQGLAVMRLVRHRLNYTQRKDNVLGKQSSDAGAVGTNPTLVWDALTAAQSLMLEAGGGQDDLCSSLNLLQSMVWGTFGHLHLTLAHCRQPQALPFSTAAADHACLAFCNTTYQQGAHQDPQAAIRSLMGVRDAFPRSQLQQWSNCAMMLLHSRCLHRRQLQRAQELARQMGAMLVPSEDAAACVIAERARADTLLYTGDPVRSVSLLHRLCDTCHANNLPLECLQAQLALAQHHQHAGAVGAALPLVLACVSTAQQLNMDTVLASALLALAALHLQRNEPEKAEKLILRFHSVFLMWAAGCLVLGACMPSMTTLTYTRTFTTA